MTDPKFNELPVDAQGDFDDIPEGSLTEEQKAERLKRRKAGLSINDTIASEANLSVGSQGVDTSGVASGSGAGADTLSATPGDDDEPIAPDAVRGPRGTGMTPRGDSDLNKS